MGGSYDFGAVKIMGNLSRQTLSDVGQDGHRLTTKGFTLGAKVLLGQANVSASLSQVRLEAQGRSTKLAVGYEYNLSKRTAIYTMLARVNNKGYTGSAAGFSAASFSLTGFGGPGQIAQNSGFNGSDIGFRHNF